MKKFLVDLEARSYPILIGRGLLSNGEIVRSGVKGSQALIVSNQTVAPIYLDRIEATLDGLQVDSVILPDGEKYKNLTTLNSIFDCLLEKKHNRTTTLIALGGGVIGDITGFAAASYQRGVNFIQVPTTLLAQVDSSVGGKTGVNHRLGKNMIGAFYQPKSVVIDVDTLISLPSRELKSGLAEVIKYGLISDEAFFLWLESNLDKLIKRDPEALTYAIDRSCRNKARIVSIDEREQGIRAILNLGHTFGHAIETYQNYTGFLHGEAVAVGMLMAAELSALHGWIGDSEVNRARELLARAGLPLNPPEGMTSEVFLELMAVDKKAVNGNIRLVLLKGIGGAVVASDYDHKLLMRTIERTINAARI